MKSIVITGSTRGIGFSMAKEFLKTGCNVTLSGRGEALGESAQLELASFQKKFIYIPCNVQDQSSLQNLWDQSLAQWGKIDIWINNAGQNTPYLYCWETQDQYTKNVVDTNITGMIYGSQIAASGMIKQGHGAIYSMEGLGSNNSILPKTILYATTKHALTFFMKGLAKELKGTNVIAGRLSPGMMFTEFITKSPEGGEAEVVSDEKFKKVFNILADHPDTVAKFFIPRILRNQKNDREISWLTNRKATWRFITAGFRKGRLL